MDWCMYDTRTWQQNLMALAGKWASTSIQWSEHNNLVMRWRRCACRWFLWGWGCKKRGTLNMYNKKKRKKKNLKLKTECHHLYINTTRTSTSTTDIAFFPLPMCPFHHTLSVNPLSLRHRVKQILTGMDITHSSISSSVNQVACHALPQLKCPFTIILCTVLKTQYSAFGSASPSL